MLNEKQRLLGALGGEPVDRPPCICPGGMMNMITRDLMGFCGAYLPEAHSNPDMMAQLASAVYESGCFENYGMPFCMTVEAEAMGARVNMGTDVYEPHISEYVIESSEQWEKLTPIDLSSGRAETVTSAIRLLKSRGSGVPIIGNITGPISLASSLMEPVVFYKELRKKNESSHRFLRFVTEELIRFANAQLDAGADVIAISDPSGTGEILGAKLFEEFAVTYLNLLLDGISQCRPATIVHICGQMHNVYPQIDMVRAGALSFDSVVSMKDARENLNGRVLMGNVSTYALEFGDGAKIAELTKACRNNGADIISPACGLGMKSPLTNVKAILSAVKEGGANA